MDDESTPPQLTLRRLKTDTLVDYGCITSPISSKSLNRLPEDSDSSEEDEQSLTSHDSGTDEDAALQSPEQAEQKVAAEAGSARQAARISQGESLQQRQLYFYVPLPGSPLWGLRTGMGLSKMSAVPSTPFENSTATAALAMARAVELQSTAANLEARAEQCEAAAKYSAASVPCEQAAPGEGALTTLMLRNIPNDYSRAMILELLDSKGLAGKYDFVYVPIDFNRGAGLGYAFVNLISSSDAEFARSRLQGFKKWKVQSPKVCEVCWGEPLQGFEAHIERYRSSPVMHKDVPDEFKPAIFKAGMRVTFPPPTKRVRPPRFLLSRCG